LSRAAEIEFLILDEEGEYIISFVGKKGTNEFEFNPVSWGLCNIRE
jgi:hypothetical protein